MELDDSEKFIKNMDPFFELTRQQQFKVSVFPFWSFRTSKTQGRLRVWISKWVWCFRSPVWGSKMLMSPLCVVNTTQQLSASDSTLVLWLCMVSSFGDESANPGDDHTYVNRIHCHYKNRHDVIGSNDNNMKGPYTSFPFWSRANNAPWLSPNTTIWDVWSAVDFGINRGRGLVRMFAWLNFHKTDPSSRLKARMPSTVDTKVELWLMEGDSVWNT